MRVTSEEFLAAIETVAKFIKEDVESAPHDEKDDALDESLAATAQDIKDTVITLDL